MRAGRLRHRVTLQQRLDVNNSGSVETTWPELGTVWGAVEPIRGREAFQAGGDLASMDTRIVLRYNSVTAQLRARDRIVWDGRVYDLQGDPVEVRTAGRELECMCLSGLSNG